MKARAVVGVIGGSGVYDLEGLEDCREHRVRTPFGDPSDALVLGRLEGVEVAFLARHGRGHLFTPSDVPYRANVYALRSLGVHHVLSISAVGSLKEIHAPGDFVLVDQFIDRTFRRVPTFFGDGIAAHVPLGDPVSARMRTALGAAAAEVGVHVHQGGTYLCIEGPQFSTRAESELYRSWGCDVIGMTNATEARLAREAGTDFCTIAMVTDYDCWHPDHAHVDVEEVIATARANARSVRALVRRSIPKVAALGNSPWRGVLQGAVMTGGDQMTAEVRRRTAALFADD